MLAFYRKRLHYSLRNLCVSAHRRWRRWRRAEGNGEKDPGQRLAYLLSRISGVGAIALSIVLLLAVFREITQPPFSIDIESVPEELAKSGLPKEAIAGLLRDEIRRLIDLAHSKNSEANLATSEDERPEISIAGNHFSVRAIARFIREFVGMPSVELSGALVSAGVVVSMPSAREEQGACLQPSGKPAAQDCFWLVLRSKNGKNAITFRQAGSLKTIVERAAAVALEEIDPIIAASYLLSNEGGDRPQEERAKHAIQLLEKYRIYNLDMSVSSFVLRDILGGMKKVALSLLMEGYAHLALGDVDRAIAKFRQANDHYRSGLFHGADWEKPIDAIANIHLQRFLNWRATCGKSCDAGLAADELYAAADGFMRALVTNPEYDSSIYNMGQIWERCARAAADPGYYEIDSGAALNWKTCQRIESDAIARGVATLAKGGGMPTPPYCGKNAREGRRFLDRALTSYERVMLSNPTFAFAHYASATLQVMALDNLACFDFAISDKNRLFASADLDFETFVSTERSFYPAWLQWGLLYFAMQHLPGENGGMPSKSQRIIFLTRSIEKFEVAISLLQGAKDDYLFQSRSRAKEALQGLQ